MPSHRRHWAPRHGTAPAQAHLLLCEAAHWAAGAALGEFAIVLCGDLNARFEHEAVLALLSGRGVRADAQEWVYGRNLGRAARVAPDGQRCRRAGPREDLAHLTCPHLPPNLCSATIGIAGICPNEALPGGPRCWDHTCAGCGGFKQNKLRVCAACPPPEGTPAPPEGAHFAPSLRCPVEGGLSNAYEACTGSSAVAVLPFQPSTGRAWGAAEWREVKDHICCSAALRATSVLAPPELDSLRRIPNLTWPSDHIAICADLEWETDCRADAPRELVVEGAAREARARGEEGAPPTGDAKRQRSWGEHSLRASLPGEAPAEGPA